LAKVDPRRGDHRPKKKGLLRGGKNQKEEGYAFRAVEKEARATTAGAAKGGGWRRRGGGGGGSGGQKRHTAIPRHL